MKKLHHIINRLKKIEKKNLWLLIVGGFFAIYLIFLLVEYVFYFDRFGPLVKIANVNVGNKNKTEASETVKNAWMEYAKSDVIFSEKNIKPEDYVTEVKIEETINQAIEEQRKGFGGLSVYSKNEKALGLNLNTEKIDALLTEENKRIFVAFENANIVLEPETKITPEKEGKELDREKTNQNIVTSFGYLMNDIDTIVVSTTPTVTTNDAEGLIEQAKSVTSQDITVVTTNGEYKIKKEELNSWLKLDRADKESTREFDFYDKIKVAAWAESLAKIVDRNPENAQLSIRDNRASVFVASKKGYKLDQFDAKSKVLAAAVGEKKINVDGVSTDPEITEEKINNLGIKEQISVGWSEFTGSPKNRTHNIKTGATKFNGVLIKPGENFSFNKILGPVDASTGYLPELVILNNKTEPQFGGGLCQVSSTAFRAALNAGLPIVARSAHAYPVVYYKPFGVDASIYLPKPDLVFTNDTEAHILIQTKVVGTKLYFEFYGTKVARTLKFSGNENGNGATEVVESMTPTIYDQDVRGKGSFTAAFFRHIYDTTGKLTDNDKFTSKYDSPEKYPKPTT